MATRATCVHIHKVSQTLVSCRDAFEARFVHVSAVLIFVHVSAVLILRKKAEYTRKCCGGNSVYFTANCTISFVLTAL